MYYGPQIMQDIGFLGSKESALLSALPLTGVHLLGKIFSLTCVENMGRRKTLLWSLPIMIFALFGLSATFYL